MHARQRKFAQQFGCRSVGCGIHAVSHASQACMLLPRIANRFGIAWNHARKVSGAEAAWASRDRTGAVQLLIEPVARYGVLSK